MINFAAMNDVPDKVDKKDLLLDVAERLFSELGYDGTSTRLIAREADVNMAMLNYYFGSKDGLYKAVLTRRLGSFRQNLASLNEESISSWEKIDRCVEMYVERVMGNNSFHRLIHREMSLQQRSETSDFIADTLLKNVGEVKRIIEEGIQNGSFRKVDVEMTVATILGTKLFLVNSSMISSRMMGVDMTDPQVLVEEIKPRLKAHLKDFLHAHLTCHDKQDSSIH
ncbi:MAG TPA: TetR family transcriptional regulator [Daejeonella sp.]|nr:TetR family transcriptional regulator [Daejeonella sp.]